MTNITTLKISFYDTLQEIKKKQEELNALTNLLRSIEDQINQNQEDEVEE